MNIRLLKKLDATIGHLVVSILSCPVQSSPLPKMHSVLIIRPGGIGDAILLAPAIISIRRFYPDVRITILAERRNAGVFPLVPEVDEVLCYDRPRELIRTLLERFDVVIDTEQWYRLSSLVARLVHAPVKIGFDTNERRRMFTHCIDYGLAVYESDNFAALLKPLGVHCPQDEGAVGLSLPVQSVIRVRQLLQPICSDSFVVIFPGASIPEKRWGAKRFSALASLLVANSFRIVVVGGSEDRADGDFIAGAGGLNLAGLTNLSESAAVIARSSLVISGDSGVLHLAVGLNVPTVSLFGPGNAPKWAPRGGQHVVLNKQLPCSPCSRYGNTPRCPENAACLSTITVDDVFAAVMTLLHREPTPAV